MAKPYTQELRDRVLAACDGGMETKPVARIFQVSPAWVRRIKQRRREEGRTTPKPMGGATVIKIDLQRLGALVRDQPDATLEELRRRLDCGCGPSAVCMALQRLGISFKKKRCTRPSRIAPTWRRPAPSGKRSRAPSTPAG